MNREIKNQEGAISILFVLLLPIFIIITGLVIDFGNTIRIETKLKNIADAAVLRAADTIYRGCIFNPGQFPEGLYVDNKFFDADGITDDDCENNGAITNTYTDIATDAAFEGITVNDQNNIVNLVQIDVDYTDSTVINTVTQYHYPAVKVTLTGSSQLFFGSFLVDDFDIVVTSVAVVGYPKKIAGGMPIAIADCALASVWDFATSQPTSTNTFTISTKASDPQLCAADTASAAWTNFDSISSSMSQVKCHVPGACWETLQAPNLNSGDIIYINNGEGSIYKEVDNCIQAGNCSDEDNKIIIPIIGTDGYFVNQDGVLSQYGTGVNGSGFYPIVGFGCATLTGYHKKQGEQWINADFSSGCSSGKGAVGGSSYYGVLLPPKLAR